MNKKLVAFLGVLVFLSIMYITLGIFVVQPIGALPEGVTIIYWRAGSNMPFVTSPDGLLLAKKQDVSLLSRSIALAAVSEVIRKRAICRMPYMEWLYLSSTGGVKFER